MIDFQTPLKENVLCEAEIAWGVAVSQGEFLDVVVAACTVISGYPPLASKFESVSTSINNSVFLPTYTAITYAISVTFATSEALVFPNEVDQIHIRYILLSVALLP